MTLSVLLSTVGLLVLGVVLIVLARWAARRRGTRWDSFVALRVGEILVTEVVGAFLIGYAIGSFIAPPGERTGAPGPPPPPGGGRFLRPGGGGPDLPFTLGVVAAAVAALLR